MLTTIPPTLAVISQQNFACIPRWLNTVLSSLVLPRGDRPRIADGHALQPDLLLDGVDDLSREAGDGGGHGALRRLRHDLRLRPAPLHRARRHPKAEQGRQIHFGWTIFVQVKSKLPCSNFEMNWVSIEATLH